MRKELEIALWFGLCEYRARIDRLLVLWLVTLNGTVFL
jgi:hypothetical protein